MLNSFSSRDREEAISGLAHIDEIKTAIEGLSDRDRRELTEWLRTKNRVSRQRHSSLTRAVAASIAMLLAYVCVEALIFHSGWYNKYLEPDSTTGQLEYNLFWLRRMYPSKVPDVLVVGDSRIAEGFSTRAAGNSVGGRLHFVNFGMPGATPRVWYYAVRDMEKDRNRFSAIVIAFDRYSDRDGADVRNNETDLNYLAGRLTLGDCWDFVASFADSKARRDVLPGCLFRGIPLRRDVRSFLSDIPARRKRTKDWRDNGAGYIAAYEGKPETLAGLSFDPATRTIGFPPGLKDWQISTVRANLLAGDEPQTGALTAYRRQWIGGILDLYRNSATRIVFMQIPNAPVALPEPNEPARFVESVRNRERLSVLPADTFRNLQRPELFADGLHLNRQGRQLFSDALAKDLEPLLTGR